MTSRKEVSFTEAQRTRLLEIVGDKAVLVGGQALAFWMERYDIDLDEATSSDSSHARLVPISYDSDFLGSAECVDEVARKMGGRTIIPRKTAITALVGSIEIDCNDDEYLNVDVIHRIVGMKAAHVEERALDIEIGNIHCRIMHPIDVLVSRVKNYHRLKDKQNENGLMQVACAMKVAKAYIEDYASNPSIENGQKFALKMMEEIVSLAKGSAGRYAKLSGMNFLEALPAAAITLPKFHKIRWPQMQKEIEDVKARIYHGKSQNE